MHDRNAEFQWTIMANTNDWLNFEHLAEDKVREGLKPPSMYKVILNNDDYTPMEFVIDVLQKFFSYDIERATQLMLKVHYHGKAVCGVFTAEVAETKYAQSRTGTQFKHGFRQSARAPSRVYDRRTSVTGTAQ